jgi:hypothetical protein
MGGVARRELSAELQAERFAQRIDVVRPVQAIVVIVFGAQATAAGVADESRHDCNDS